VLPRLPDGGPSSKISPPPQTDTYHSQTTFVLSVQGSKTTSLIYIAEWWNAADLGDCIIPVGTPVVMELRSIDCWLSLRQGKGA